MAAEADTAAEPEARQRPVQKIRHAAKDLGHTISLNGFFDILAGTPGLSPEQQKERLEAAADAVAATEAEFPVKVAELKDRLADGLSIVQGRIDDPDAYAAYQSRKASEFTDSGEGSEGPEEDPDNF